LQKNKSAKVKQQVAQLQAQAAVSGKSRETVEKEKEKALRAKQKAEEEKRAKEEAALLRPVQTQKVPFGVDPKTVLCVFFKAGQCEKGTKCKFSHDPDVGRKVEKKNLYQDSREEKMAGLCALTHSDVCSPSDYSRWCRHNGQVGRREVGTSGTVESWKSTDHNRCAFSAFLS
jgi:hypothetical protein